MVPKLLLTVFRIFVLAHFVPCAVSDDPLTILGNSNDLTMTFDTTLGFFDEAYVDQLELRAATRCILNIQNNGTPVAVPDPAMGTPDPSTVKEQLAQARATALALKSQLYGPPLLDLIADETSEGSRRLRACAEASHGSFTMGHVEVHVKGNMNVSVALPSLESVFGLASESSAELIQDITEDFLFPAHPEHYEIVTYNGIGVTETWGGIPTRSWLDVLATIPEYVSQYRDTSYPISVSARGYLEDDTTVVWTLQQFKDTSTGLQLNLRIWYPSARPPEYVHDHVEHFCVEYRNGLRLIAAGLGY